MITKISLRPTVCERVRDVAQAVGVSIDGWKPNDRHRNSRWCFGKVGVANLGFVWWKHLKEDANGNIYFLNDAADWADKCRRRGETLAAGKADEFNNLINSCYFRKEFIRVAIIDGNVNPNDDEREKASKRQLDDVKWYPHHRDPVSGFMVVMRGVPQPRDFDPNAEYAASVSPAAPTSVPLSPPAPEPDTGEGEHGESAASSEAGDADVLPERKTSMTTAFPRDSEVVRAVKLRVVDGKCECCGAQGFVTERGGYYLEVHHVVPLSCDGVDAPWNAMAICPGDHKRAHFGADRKDLRDKMVQLLGNRFPEKLEKLLEMVKKMDSNSNIGDDLEREVEF